MPSATIAGTSESRSAINLPRVSIQDFVASRATNWTESIFADFLGSRGNDFKRVLALFFAGETVSVRHNTEDADVKYGRLSRIELKDSCHLAVQLEGRGWTGEPPRECFMRIGWFMLRIAQPAYANSTALARLEIDDGRVALADLSEAIARGTPVLIRQDQNGCGSAANAQKVTSVRVGDAPGIWVVTLGNKEFTLSLT